MTDKQMITLYIDTVIAEKIKDRATKRDWSVNKWIAHALARAVRER